MTMMLLGKKKQYKITAPTQNPKEPTPGCPDCAPSFLFLVSSSRCPLRRHPWGPRAPYGGFSVKDGERENK
jgi:hypothetical protein